MTLTTLIKRIARNGDLIHYQDRIITAQSQLIAHLKRERQETQLDYAREMQGLFAAWMLSLEMPEMDLRDTLVAAEQAIGEKIATLEEHIL